MQLLILYKALIDGSEVVDLLVAECDIWSTEYLFRNPQISRIRSNRQQVASRESHSCQHQGVRISVSYEYPIGRGTSTDVMGMQTNPAANTPASAARMEEIANNRHY